MMHELPDGSLASKPCLDLLHVRFPSTDDAFRVLFVTADGALPMTLSLASTQTKMHWECRVAPDDAIFKSLVDPPSTFVEVLRASLLALAQAAVSTADLSRVDVRRRVLKDSCSPLELALKLPSAPLVLPLVLVEMRPVDFLYACVDDLQYTNRQLASRIQDLEATKDAVASTGTSSSTDKAAAELQQLRDFAATLVLENRQLVETNRQIETQLQETVARRAQHDAAAAAAAPRPDDTQFVMQQMTTAPVWPREAVRWTMHSPPNAHFAIDDVGGSVVAREDGYYCILARARYGRGAASMLSVFVDGSQVYVACPRRGQDGILCIYVTRLHRHAHVFLVNQGEATLEPGTTLSLHWLGVSNCVLSDM
ncbi:Aste57867_8202 [Aphanomyces stellatus]|uniref:Aste57867_8202 protein n=1 Tax=Aphanomyces stellatus TaxID=120398 RepID=A0A485KJL8_9STRA|nr:hypothetical protein As57867_008171 [Aphanomyces stellatus]VFT85089.1 Aste57867_8202 [Aphanomyces stellatus]